MATYREDLLQRLRDPDYAILYLSEVLREAKTAVPGDERGVFILALYDVAEANHIVRTDAEKDQRKKS